MGSNEAKTRAVEELPAQARLAVELDGRLRAVYSIDKTYLAVRY